MIAKEAEADMGSTGGGSVAAAFANQLAYCRANGAPVTARICAAIGAVVAGDHCDAFTARIRNWTGAPIADALPLRAAAGVHALHLSGVAISLATIYAGQPADDIAIVADVIAANQAALLPWLDGPPQTNEAGRSSNFIAAMLWVADQRLPPRFECLEIGSSAGINLMLDRYFYDLGGVTVGPGDSVMRFAPEWRGPSPPDRAISFASIRGCDIAPVDLADPAQAMKLRAYIWPEHHIRFQRIDAAIAMARAMKPDLVAANAADFIDAELAKPQPSGTVRVVMHSIVWQYLSVRDQARIEAAMALAGASATAERPVAWIALEANRTVHHHELVVRLWRGVAGDGDPVRLGTAHAHGAWLEWSPG